jgi:Fe-S cluster biogenesis protein NfuA
MYIQTEATPNPCALKFYPGVDVSKIGPVHFSNLKDAISKSTFAVNLFRIENVSAVFFGSDFITVTKTEESSWDILKPQVLMTIMDHFLAGLEVFDNNFESSKINESSLSDIEKQIIEIIETRVRPSVAMDGGDITYVKFENGIVFLELHGACSGCPSSSMTLKNGIESMLQHFIPEVEAVEAV